MYTLVCTKYAWRVPNHKAFSFHLQQFSEMCTIWGNEKEHRILRYLSGVLWFHLIFLLAFPFIRTIQRKSILTDTCVAVYEFERARLLKNNVRYFRFTCAMTSPLKKQNNVATHKPCMKKKKKRETIRLNYILYKHMHR